jgi:hypothetical protein
VWNLYHPCDTTTPADQLIAYSSNYTPGVIIKGSNGLCYTIAVTGYSMQSPITVVSEHSNCNECDPAPATSTPTPPPAATSTPTPEPAATSTPTPVAATATPTPLPMVWNLYHPCDSTTPADQVIEYSVNYTPGIIIKGSNGLCYTIAVTGYSMQSPITVVSEHSNCSECDPAPATSTPTPPPAATSTPTPTPEAATSTPTPLPDATSTPTPEPPTPQPVWNLFHPCGSSVPADQVIEYTENYTPGIIIRGTNGICYTIANSGTSLQTPIGVLSEHSTCEDCEN